MKIMIELTDQEYNEIAADAERIDLSVEEEVLRRVRAIVLVTQDSDVSVHGSTSYARAAVVTCMALVFLARATRALGVNLSSQQISAIARTRLDEALSVVNCDVDKRLCSALWSVAYAWSTQRTERA